MTTNAQANTSSPAHSIFSRKPVVLLCALISTTLWGSAFPMVKLGYDLFEIGPQDLWAKVLFAGYRMFAASLILLLVGKFQNYPLLPPVRLLPKILVLGILTTTIQYSLHNIGLYNTTATNASILSSSHVFMNVILGACLFAGDQITLVKVLGLLLGTTGILLVYLPGSGGISPFTLVGDGLVLAAQAGMSTGSAYLRWIRSEAPVFLLTAWQMFVGSILIVVPSVILAGPMPFLLSAPGLLNLGYLACLSAVAFTLWNQVICHNPLGKVSLFLFLMPVSGAILSSLILHEQLKAGVIGGLILVSIAIVIVNYQWRSLSNGEVGE